MVGCPPENQSGCIALEKFARKRIGKLRSENREQMRRNLSSRPARQIKFKDCVVVTRLAVFAKFTQTRQQGGAKLSLDCHISGRFPPLSIPKSALLHRFQYKRVNTRKGEWPI